MMIIAIVADTVRAGRWNHRTGYLAGALALVGAGGCAPEHTEEPRSSVVNTRDSVGIEIVDNPAGGISRADWSVSSKPTVVIGSSEGHAAEMFSQVRSAVRREDGSIVVIDGLTNEVRFFSPEGDHLFTRGGSGDGPGEFRQASQILALCADSVMIHDLFRGRLTVFRPDGSLERTHELRNVQGFTPGMMPLGLTADDRLVIQGLPTAPPPAFGPAPANAPWYLSDLDGVRLEKVGETPVAFGATDADGSPLPVLPFVVPLKVMAGGGLWSATGIDPELRTFGWDGSLERIVRFADVPNTLTASEVERILDWYRGRMASSPAAGAQSPLPDPVVLPAAPLFSHLIVDAAENIWVQEVATDRDPETWTLGAPRGSQRWRILDPNGVWQRSLTLPEGFQPFSIGHDYLLGVSTDEFGVEVVHLYDLVKQ